MADVCALQPVLLEWSCAQRLLLPASCSEALPAPWRTPAGYSTRSMVTGSILTARTAAGSAARNAAAKRINDGKASIGRSVALT